MSRAWKRGLSAVGALALLAAVAIALASEVQIVSLQVAPATLQIGVAQGGRVTAHVGIPFSQVDCGSVTMNGVAATACFADDRGDLVAKFPEAAIEATVAPPSGVMTLTGATKTGVPFAGTAAVSVTVFRGR